METLLLLGLIGQILALVERLLAAQGMTEEQIKAAIDKARADGEALNDAWQNTLPKGGGQ